MSLVGDLLAVSVGRGQVVASSLRLFGRGAGSRRAVIERVWVIESSRDLISFVLLFRFFLFPRNCSLIVSSV